MVVGLVDVLSALVLAGFVLLVVSLVITPVLARRRREPAPPPPAPEAREDLAAREARHRLVDERGSELIERRVELDARRGTLGSYVDVNEQFTRLEERFKAGQISEDEFEAEKIRLLTQGGG